MTTNATVDKFSRLVPIDEIRANDYNLNIPRYVDSSTAAESWDVYATMFGGVPKAVVDALERYWKVWPSLKGQLYRDAGGSCLAPAPDDVAHAANCLVNRRKQTEEELRLLYVALTRAKNHLFVVGAGKEYLFRNDAFRPTAATNSFSWIMDAVTRKFGSQDFHGTRKLGSIELNAVAKEAVPSVSENIAEELDRTKDIAWEDFVYPYAEATTLGTKVAASGLDKMNSPVFSNDFSSDLFSPVLEYAGGATRTELGTAYHRLLEKSDFAHSDAESVRHTLESCVTDGLIEERVARELDLKKITACLNNPELKALAADGKIYHELPFLATASFKELGLNASTEQTILQGVADMLILKENGAVVVDFKFTKRPDMLVKNYALQLKAYGLAVNKILGLSVETYVLSIDDNKLIKIV